MRRCPGWRLLRGQTADALRMGRSLGRGTTDARRARSDPGGAAARGSFARGLFRLAQGGARKGGGAACDRTEDECRSWAQRDCSGIRTGANLRRRRRADRPRTGGGPAQATGGGPHQRSWQIERDARLAMVGLQTPEPYDPILDAPLLPPAGHRSASILERVLRKGWFAVTAELNPPDSADPRDVLRAAEPLKDVADAVNATDASGANCHMSSMGICSILSRAGLGIVLQISCRDRNRIAIQGDVLGAAAMGVGNVLCLTGDGVGVGDQPGAKPVFDLDSLSLLRTLRTMRDDATFLSGRTLSTPPRIFLGAAENPCIPPLEWRADRLEKKVRAGADFIQTNYIYDVPVFAEFMKRVRDMGLDERVFILAGVGPLASAKTARWMRRNVPGIHIPEAIIHRLERAANPAEERKELCIDLIQQVRAIAGVKGVHVMAYRREHLFYEIIKESGILQERLEIKARQGACHQFQKAWFCSAVHSGLQPCRITVAREVAFS